LGCAKDSRRLLHRAERCVQLLDCAEAGLLLADGADALQVMASSSERTDALNCCSPSFGRLQAG
jgi:hypothetical protein